jgi:hypothetical protein
MSDRPEAQKRLADGLARAAGKLEAGDLEGAAKAFDGVVEACTDCEAAGVILNTDELQTVKRLFDRCGELAVLAQTVVRARQLMAGASSRARKRYSSL